MRRAICTGLFAVLLAPAMAAAQAQAPKRPWHRGIRHVATRAGFQAIEKTEELIAHCMREQGFQYIAADHNTVRAGMSADKRLPGLSEEEFVNRYGLAYPPSIRVCRLNYRPATVPPALASANAMCRFSVSSPRRTRSPTIAPCLGTTCPAPSRSRWRSKICRVPAAAHARLSLKHSNPIS